MSDQAMRMSDSDFAILGADQLAYVREMSADEASEIATSTGLPVRGIKLYGLFSADGRRMAVTDSIETAYASAQEHHLVTLSVH